MSTSKLNKVIMMNRDIKALQKFEESFKSQIKKQNVDKHNVGFNADHRFSAFSVNVSFDSHTGNYGSSSCYTYLRLQDSDSVKKAFISYLNKNMYAVLEGIANELKIEASKFVQDAEAEVKEWERLLEEAKGQFSCHTSPNGEGRFSETQQDAL